MRVAQNVKCSFLPSFPFKDEHTKCLVELLTFPWYIIVYIGVLHHSPFCWSAREALFIFIVSGSPMASSSSRLRCSTSPAPRASPRTLTVVRKRSLESRNAVNGSSMADGAWRVRAYLQGEDNMKRQNYWRARNQPTMMRMNRAMPKPMCGWVWACLLPWPNHCTVLLSKKECRMWYESKSALKSEVPSKEALPLGQW